MKTIITVSIKTVDDDGTISFHSVEIPMNSCDYRGITERDVKSIIAETFITKLKSTIMEK